MNIEISAEEYERELNWYDGMMYCQLLEIDGKNDWRMPTLDELQEIYESESDLKKAVFCWYWSSTEFNDECAWYQNYCFGSRYSINKLKRNYVRAVRSI